MAYDNLHNIVSKKQHIEQKGIQFDGVLKAGYELAYNYNSEKPHQVANIVDDNYRTEGMDAQELTRKDHKYQYDANGNLVYINTERPKKDGTQTPKSTERKLLWDEENRLEAIDDNGFVSNYWYDAAGERTVKTSGEGEEIYVNSVFSGGSTQTADFTAYINPYLVVSKGGNYTKHIYIGSQRIVSKLGDLDSYGQDPRRIEYAGSNVDGANVDYAGKYDSLQQTIKDRYVAFEVPYHGTDNDDYVNGTGFCCDDTPRLKSFDPGKNDNPELFQYYYHSDHLGSSSLITDLDGEVVQHVEYVPFGEVFIEERNNTWNTPYLFNAKELDEETGLVYYGARYYDPRVSLWLSTDPLQEKYPNMSTYVYCSLNPVNRIDPDGMDDIFNDKGYYVRSTNTKTRNIRISIGGKEVSILKLNLNNSKERQIAATIVGYYAKEAGVSFVFQGGERTGANPKGYVGVGRMDGHENAAAWNLGDDIFIRRKGGTLSSPLMEDANNMINTLVHEDEHKVNEHSSNPKLSTVDKETMAVSAQIKHSSYLKTTSDFQEGILNGYGEHLENSGMRDAAIEKRVNDINALLPKGAKWKLASGSNFGSPIVKAVPNK